MTQGNEIKAYKIRNRETGLYSTGGSNPYWRKTGKVWGNLGGLKNHLNAWCNQLREIKDIPDEWDIVEIIIKEEEAKTWPARVVSDKLKRNKAIKEKYGWWMANALDEFKDLDFERYRYAFEIEYGSGRYKGLDDIRKELKNLGLKRENYRYRTPVILFDNIEHAFTVKLVFGEKVKQFVDLIELKDITSTST